MGQTFSRQKSTGTLTVQDESRHNAIFGRKDSLIRTFFQQSATIALTPAGASDTPPPSHRRFAILRRHAGPLSY